MRRDWDTAGEANNCADVHGALDAAINGFGRVMNGQHATGMACGTEHRLTAGVDPRIRLGTTQVITLNLLR
jgi:hypothetical protein